MVSNSKDNLTFDDMHSRLSMLIQLYAPNVEEEYQIFLGIWADAQVYLASNNLVENEYVERMEQFTEAYIHFKSTLREEFKQYI